MITNRPLVLRSNRFFGSALIDAGLIDNEALESANERLLEAVQQGDHRGANLLNILLYDLKVLDETALLDHLVESNPVGIIDLANYDISTIGQLDVNIELCWSTFTLPFDRVENLTMIASAYYLSKPAVNYWDEQFGGQTIWYITSVASIADALERYTALVGSTEKTDKNGKPPEA